MKSLIFFIKRAQFSSYVLNLFRVAELLARSSGFCKVIIDETLMFLMRFLLTLRVRHSKGLFILFVYIMSVNVTSHASPLSHYSQLTAQREEVNDPDGIGYVDCPLGQSRKVNRDNPYAGARVSCANFDLFFELLESGQIEKAGGLLETPRKPDLRKKLLKIKFRRTPSGNEKILISPVERV